MSSSEQAVASATKILASSKEFPWKTARYLSKKLLGEDLQITAKELERALLAHAKEPDRKVRYSFFPARKSLDLLWGHIDVVNDISNLPDPHLEYEFGDFEPCDMPEERIWCFLSHSFYDLPEAQKIYHYLLNRGYGVWLAEAEVQTGTMIVKAVQRGIERCDHFVLYASRNSLGSRWVLKEGLDAIGRWGMPVTVILDGRDDEMVSLFEDWLEDRWVASQGESWNITLERRVKDLVPHVHVDTAATPLSELLIAGLGEISADQRVAVLSPFPKKRVGTKFRTIKEVFQKSKKSGSA